MKIFNKNIPFIRVCYSKEIVNCLGELNVSEQNILDLLVSQIQENDLSNRKYLVSFDDIINHNRRLTSKSSVTISRVFKNFMNKKITMLICLKHPGEDVFKRMEESNDEFSNKFEHKYIIKDIPIFEYIHEVAPRQYVYIFSEEFARFIFNLDEDTSFCFDLNTSQLINSKTALILFKTWCANKNGNAELWGTAYIKFLKIALGIQNKNTLQTTKNVQRGLKVLRKIFGNRYYITTGSSGKSTDEKFFGYGFFIFGDNSTSYPIANKKSDTGNKNKDIVFLNDECYDRNMRELHRMKYEDISQ